jgi:hypothetical protein
MSDASGNGKKGRGLVNYGEFAPRFSGWMPICPRGFSRVHPSSRLRVEKEKARHENLGELSGLGGFRTLPEYACFPDFVRYLLSPLVVSVLSFSTNLKTPEC